MGLDVWLFGRTLRLLPYFIWANSEGSGKTVRMHRLTWAFTGCLCDKYHNLMSWLIFSLKQDIKVRVKTKIFSLLDFQFLYEISVSFEVFYKFISGFQNCLIFLIHYCKFAPTHFSIIISWGKHGMYALNKNIILKMSALLYSPVSMTGWLS